MKKITCPKCGSEFNVIDGNMKAKERIEALKAAGVDVSNLFAMQSADGVEHVGAIINGSLNILDDEDPIFLKIKENGDVPNRKLFRRFVMAQTFHLMYHSSDFGNEKSVDKLIIEKGYEYRWKMLLDELHAQTKMSKEEREARQLWFNSNTVLSMMHDYIKILWGLYYSSKIKIYNHSKYIKIEGKRIFVSDFCELIDDLNNLYVFACAKERNVKELYRIVEDFNEKRIKITYKTSKKIKVEDKWLNAYKGAGAYYTLQNMIRFHGCVLYNKEEKPLSKHESLEYLDKLAKEYQQESWRLYGVLRKCLKDNNIDVAEKIRSWRK